MPQASLLEAPELAAARIDARARGENFPVASLIAPRWARPHLRAIYGFARLVDNLGDEAPGDRGALLDELERGEKKFLIDFAQTGYIDSSGLGVLVSLSKKIREQGGELRLANLNDDLKTLFEPYGTVLLATVIKGPLAESLHFGYVEMETLEEANRAVVAINARRLGAPPLRTTVLSESER